ncbi:DUF747-domain-containing protein [Venturia nashicola]|uniref:DUF747-domain-containing protein n=1 Tax=Venturia nashicola TaxID=86259 RepID=A0A4Z1NXC4_9PEZI|nr:DUF747-domain-containing protein [Venturia nashicola]
MNEWLSPNVQHDCGRMRRSSESDQYLPTPSITPSLETPLLSAFSPSKETLLETLEERLERVATKDFAATLDAAPAFILQSDRGSDLSHQGREDHRKAASPVAIQEVLKLSSQQIQELTNSPTSLPLRPASPVAEVEEGPLSAPPHPRPSVLTNSIVDNCHEFDEEQKPRGRPKLSTRRPETYRSHHRKDFFQTVNTNQDMRALTTEQRPGAPSRTVSTPPIIRRKHSSKGHTSARDGLSDRRPERAIPSPMKLKEHKQEKENVGGNLKASSQPGTVASPVPHLPLPPMSIPTFLQLELASERPSPLYIHHSSTSDYQYEDSSIKFERLLNFISLPFQLERILQFGAWACFDAWLYTFTILPLRFVKALLILIEWWLRNAWKELCDLVDFVYRGIGRLHRRTWSKTSRPRPATPSGDKARSRSTSIANPSPENPKSNKQESAGVLHAWPDPIRRPRKGSAYKHRRTRSTPSLLLSSHKSDLLKGLLILLSCLLLMQLDPSRMYHNIRGQSAMKLYVIYNVLEVSDRLLSAIGQDVLECLFCRETLERGADGRSKLIRPLWIFVLALVYNVLHASALFYQVITLNVAVNSYSNALLTLLMSNQFVEIKGAVFKKFEKDNLFQLTCADVVERFQLWLMLLIIAMRNVVEVGGFSISLGGSFTASSTSSPTSNATGVPISNGSILPQSFTILPKLTGQVLGPFVIVLGSEMAVDWLKHAYIGKFNNTKPNIYGRFYDVLAKDYYSNAFADQNLTKRLGLPVYALACLFIRASIQTYHMFLAAHFPSPLPNLATSISLDSDTASTTPATIAALAHIDQIFRRALGRSTFGGGGEADQSSVFSWWSIDDLIAFSTMLVFFFVIYLLLLALKLVLGMVLLSVSRRRYKGMKEREKAIVDTYGKRIGGWGTVEVDEDKRRWIYVDDEKGLEKIRDRDRKAQQAAKDNKGTDYDKVMRYDMVAKRIW